MADAFDGSFSGSFGDGLETARGVLVNLQNHYRGATAPTNPVEGMFWIFDDGVSNVDLRVYIGGQWRTAIADLENASGTVAQARGSYTTDVVPASAVFTLDVLFGVTFGRLNLTEDSSVAFGTLEVGGRYLFQSEGNGFALSFPSTVTVVRGEYDPFRKNHIEINVVSSSEQIVSIRTQQTDVLLFRHDMTKAGVFTSRAEIFAVGQESLDVTKAPKYSQLSDLETFRRSGGEFRFRLVFPTLGEEIIWEQNNNFVADAIAATDPHVVTAFNLLGSTSATVRGAGPYTAAGPPAPFGGLSWNDEHVDDDPTSVPLIDGFAGAASAYWPIGQSTKSGDQNLLVAFDNGTNTVTDIIELYAIGE